MTNEQAERILELEMELANYKDDAENEIRILREEYDKIHGLLRKAQSRLARYDDTRPIDEAGLRGLGFSQIDSMPYYKLGKVGVAFHEGNLFSVTFDVIHTLGIKTMGRLNLLLDALGIGGGGDHQQEESE